MEKDKDLVNYNRIARAIGYLKQHFKEQPSLEAVADYVNLSPFHFQRTFKEWAGVSPKKFLQFVSISHARKLLQQDQLNLFDVAHETGLSGTGRLHDLFITIEGMTPAEYKNGGRELSITYSFEKSPFGEILIASTHKGICHLVFTDGYQNPLDTLLETFPYARFEEGSDTHQEKARSIFSPKGNTVDTLDLHVKGTGFQLKVWEALLKIPEGKLSSYGHLAKQIGKPKASRAVGTAIGSNPVAYLIPCHRVIQSGGGIGGYRWGENRKWAMIGRECAK